MLQLLRRTTTTAAAVIFSRTTTATTAQHFSSSTATSNLPKPFSKIPWKCRPKAIQASQEALTGYLHTTRLVPFPYAEEIATNSPHSLSKIVSEIPFSPSTFASSFERFLRYHPINELEFLLESIGLHCDDKNGIPRSILPPNTFFLSDWKHFDVVCALAELGFPWSKLGVLYRDECSIFDVDQSELQRKICGIKDGYGFNSACVIGICLTFPRVLNSEMDGLLRDLRVLFLDYDLLSSVECNVDAMLDVCEKIKMFYDLGCEMGKFGELMGRSKRIFVDYSKEVLFGKIKYFCELNVRKDRVGLFLLSRPEIFGFDLETRAISVAGFLVHFGLGENEVKSLEQKYFYVFGRNRIANVPHIMRSMDLGEWFFERLLNVDTSLLITYTMNSTEDLDKDYIDGLKKIQATRTCAHAIKKLNFLHSVGFGENRFAVKALFHLHSAGSQLQQRFNCLVQCGIEYSKVCALVNFSPKILNQHVTALLRKIEYLCNDMGSSVQHLDVFPEYLCYHLEKRIKPRFEVHKWVNEQGFCKKQYSISTIVASSEKTFVARLSRMHQASAKKWQEKSAP